MLRDAIVFQLSNHVGPAALSSWWALPVGMFLLAPLMLPLLIALLLLWYFMMPNRLDILLDQRSITVGGRSFAKRPPAEYYIDHHRQVLDAAMKGRAPNSLYRGAIEVALKQPGGPALIAAMRGDDLARAQGLINVLHDLELRFLDAIITAPVESTDTSFVQPAKMRGPSGGAQTLH